MRTAAIARFGLNEKYSVLFDKTGRAIKSFEDIQDQAVVLLSTRLSSANDFGLRKFTEQYYFENASTKHKVAIPFGLNRKKIEQLFYKIDQIEKSMPQERPGPEPAPEKTDSRKAELISESDMREGVSRVFQVIEADKTVLDSKGAQQLYAMMK